eukprot:10366975-Alexandrium_andersonii.AAC.1
MAPAISNGHAAIVASHACPAGAAAAAARERCASQALSGFRNLAMRAPGSGPRAATAAWSQASLAVPGGAVAS